MLSFYYNMIMMMMMMVMFTCVYSLLYLKYPLKVTVNVTTLNSIHINSYFINICFHLHDQYNV